MLLRWVLAGSAAMAAGLGILRASVFLESYVLLATGVALAASAVPISVRQPSDAVGA